MLNFPSSLQISVIEDKQNINPNHQRTKATAQSPYGFKKNTVPSNKSEEFLSVYQTIQQDNDEQQQVCPNTNNSVKILLEGFCKPIEETIEKQEAQSLVGLVKEVFDRNQLTLRQAIEICEQHQIYNKEDLCKSSQQRINSKKSVPLKKILCTQLGNLKIQYLCEKLRKDLQLSQEQLQIIQILIPGQNQEISENTLRQQYEILKEELIIEEKEGDKLYTEFKTIRKNKIQPKLRSDHFRLELNKMIYTHTRKGKISYSSLCKILQKHLNTNEISIVFRFVYHLQKENLLTILDPSKEVKSQILLTNLMGQDQIQTTSSKLQQKNRNYMLEQNHERISKLERQNNEYKVMLVAKDAQIERLYKVIELMQIEKQEEQKFNMNKMQIQMQANKKKYQSRIQSLIQKNKEQVKLTEWYQRQLQAIMEEVNRENVIRKFLTNNHG